MATCDPVRLVVFDCDGTLVDSQHNIFAAMAAAFADHDIACPPAACVRSVVGLSLVEAVAALIPAAGADRHERVAESYKAHFHRLRQRPDHEEPLYEGALACLDRLQAEGFRLGIATGKSRRGLEATLKRHGLEGRFVTLQTADQAPGKPAPAMLTRAMAAAGAEAAQTLMVGDTTFDIEMGRNAGVAAVGVGWGYHRPAALSAAGAAAVIERFDALVPLAIMLTGGE